MPRKAIIIHPDRRWEPVPEPFIDYEEMPWPPVLPASPSGQVTPILKPSDFYRRHTLIEGELFVFLKDSTL